MSKRDHGSRTARKGAAKVSDPASPTPIKMVGRTGETDRELVARKMVGPFNRHGMVTGETVMRHLGCLEPADKPGLAEFAHDVRARAEKAASGDIVAASEILMAQALSLDCIFTEYARIALVNVTNHMEASERYMRLALKAQANSRATLEALAKLHQPREQTVRHVHVNDGGQAIVADQLHHHAGGPGNGKAVEQAHATGAIGVGAAVPGPNSIGAPVPITSREGQGALSDARRKVARCPGGKPERVEARRPVGGDSAVD